MVILTVSLLNYRGIPAITELCAKLKVCNFAFARYCPTNGSSDYNMPPNLYREFLAGMWNVFTKLANAGTRFSLKDHLMTAYLYEEGLIELHPDKNIIFGGCNCGFRHLTLLPNGTVYACRRFDSLVGNIFYQSFSEIFFSSKLERYRQIGMMDGCNKCELLNYCRGCHAVSAGTTGNFFNKDPQCWRC